MATSGAHKCPKSEKLDEAQALAKSCAGRPDFLPCDGLSICATHSHGKCFKLHWCCHLGWCHFQMRAVVARASPASQPASSAQLRSFPTRGEDGRTCGSRSWEALMMAQHTDQ
ncbi:UPF0524 C3orf70-like protein B [Oryzias melastigma]|uniref:UPF0524 C3orf70-like protein B n=1 Tax=Oryzias melastigma TaxID=30732 RepID=A0A834FA75_ORYME|nr:UPF0524 C3orf70-like protein B [Oryzias melastigma]